MNTTAQVKQNIKKSLKQMGDEPLEILKTAKKQVGMENDSTEDVPSNMEEESNNLPQENPELKKQVEVSDKRNLERLEGEMEEIRRKKLFDSLLSRIQQGEDVPIEEFQELSYEQRDVLKAQIEAMKAKTQTSSETPLSEPATKRSRRFGGFGKRKSQAEKQQTHVEMPLPPSG